ncbi:hypothetical protein D3C79_1035070 [compost metagenome]
MQVLLCGGRLAASLQLFTGANQRRGVNDPRAAENLVAAPAHGAEVACTKQRLHGLEIFLVGSQHRGQQLAGQR